MSCRKVVEYKIRKGKFNPKGYPFNQISPFIGKYQRIKYSFDIDCPDYYLGRDQDDWNKLPGIVFKHPHKDSCRIGWRKKKKLEYCIYIYDNSQRKIIDIPTTSTVEILNGKRDWFIKTDSNTFKVPKSKTGWWGYKGGGPRFGGNRKAQSDITVKIDYELF